LAKVIVTGANGFIGLHTVKALLKEGYEVAGIDLHIDNLQDIADANLKTVQFDICRDMLINVVEPGDKVLHLAAIATFRDCEEHPAAALNVNTTGTMRLLNACREKGAERFVFSSTGSVYGDKVTCPIGETHPRNPASVYGYTKLFAEQLVEYYGVPYITLRYGYIYGPGKTHGAIGAFVSRLLKRIQPTIFGGQQLNDFTSVHDIVDANLLALESPYLNHDYNIGAGEVHSLMQVYKYCQQATGVNIEAKIVPKRGFDPDIFVYDIKKAQILLKYQPKGSLLEGIKEVVNCLQ